MQEGAPNPSVISPGQQPQAPAPSPPQPEATPTWKFNDTIPDSAEPGQTVDEAPVSWSASEFIAHNKSASWYLAVGVAAVLIDAGIFFLTRDKITTVMLLVVALLFGIMGSRKPRELQYIVDDRGVSIGGKFYPYSVFKSFSVVQEEGIESIWFMPLKRLMPGLSIYFAPQDGQKIIDVLVEFLPFEDKHLDPVDKLMHRLHF